MLPVEITETICSNCPYRHDKSPVFMRRLTEMRALTEPEGIKYLLVGEAPGQNEEEQGIPFVGASGMLLTNLLDKILEPEMKQNVALSNAVRCRPPKNANPRIQAKRHCQTYLQQEIDSLPDLEVIITLGTQPFATLLPDVKGGITSNRLKVFEYHGYPLVGTFHPAAVIYDKTKGQPLYDDLYAYLRSEVWKEKDVPRIDVGIINDQSLLRARLGAIVPGDRIGLDIETIGFSNLIVSMAWTEEERDGEQKE